VRIPRDFEIEGNEAIIRKEGNRLILSRKGTPIGGNDLFITAHALSLDLTPVTANVREFSRLPRLRVENWLYI
jgi:predicted nucleic acid-binding protein